MLNRRMVLGQKKVPVFTKDGKVIGYVSIHSTSVGASKVARAPVEFSNRFGCYGWVMK